MDEFEEMMKYCYRVDEYIVSDPDVEPRRIDKFKEYFLVAGEHSLIRVIDWENAYCYIEVFNKTFFTILDLEYSIYSICDLRKMVMTYDYILTELRKIDKEEVLNSRLLSLKMKAERALESGIYEGDNIYDKIPRKAMEEIDERAQYLAYAYKLEWDGVIGLGECKKFDSISDLDEFVEENDLKNCPEGVDKKIRKCLFASINDSGLEDPLEFIRPIRPQLWRYNNGILKDKKLLKLEKSYSKSEIRAEKLYNRMVGLSEKLEEENKKTNVKKLQEKLVKFSEKITKETAQIVFIK